MLGMFRCTVVTPQEQVLDEEVTYVSIPAHDGQVGLAHLRAELLVKLGHDSMRIEDTKGNSRLYLIGGGFAQMADNKLTVLTGEAKPANQMDKEQAKQDLKNALEIKAISDDQVADRHEKQTRARAMIALAGHKS